MREFMERVVLVTGASAGLGRATCNAVAGWQVVGGSRRGTADARWTGVVLDVDDDDSVASVIASIIERHGRIDAVVCAAGYGLAGPVETTSIPEAKAQLETNFWGAVRVTLAVLPHLRSAGQGRIVVMSSIGGEIGIPFQAYYSASKFALEGWAEALAYEVAPFGVHVTLIQPGNFATDFTDSRRFATEDAGPYAEASLHAINVMERDERGGAAPADAAAVIVSQLEAARPRRRVSVGRTGERFGLVAKRLLPHAWFERAAKESLGVK
jgi:NAD(P)-dependent dehydrogenase (short-subunit alcohol dehydrogenase family)